MSKMLEFAGVGEVLMDLFDGGGASLGGAPLNVVVHCHRLLQSVGRGRAMIVSSVGDDEHGRHIRSVLSAEGLPLDFLGTSALPTGTSSVFVREGEAGFEIAEDVAWDDLHGSASMDALATRCNAVCFGSLGQRTAAAKEMTQRFIGLAKNARILYDVNLRTNAISGSRGYSREIIETSCRLASIIKANQNEVAELGKLFGVAVPAPTAGRSTADSLWKVMEFLLAEFPAQAAVVTRGAEGALLLSRHDQIEMAASPAYDGPVHPVGAGDAFSAGVLFGMAQSWNWRTTLELASLMGSWVAYSESDIPALSPDILSYVRSRI